MTNRHSKHNTSPSLLPYQYLLIEHYPASVWGKNSSYLGLFFFFYIPLSTNQIFLVLSLKYIQDLTTCHHYHCCHLGSIYPNLWIIAVALYLIFLQVMFSLKLCISSQLLSLTIITKTLSPSWLVPNKDLIPVNTIIHFHKFMVKIRESTWDLYGSPKPLNKGWVN